MATLTGRDIDRLTAAGRAAVERVSFLLPGHRFVIAGGFFRDTLLGGQIMDVDVFTLPNTSWEAKDAFRRPPEQYGDLAGTVTHIGSLPNGTPTGIVIQRILLNPNRFPDLTNEVVCDRIDIGLCRIAMDQDGELYVSEEAQNDYEGNVLTVLRTNGEDSSRVRARLEKIQDRYPDIGFIQDDPLGLLEPEEELSFD
ncbi:MAG: hypothetical protein AAF608_05170 [Pseudomonadota bacterium]